MSRHGGTAYDTAPLRVYWEVTRACDLACRHCRAEAAPEPDPAELTTGEGLGLIDRLATFGPPAPHLVLTGGDPLKRPDLFVLIERARAAGFGVSVSPSGTPLLTPGLIGRLKAAGVEAISLSLDGSTAERHDAIRGVHGCFERTIGAARAAATALLPFQVNTLVSEETLEDLDAVGLLAARLGAARWSLFFLVGVGRGTVLHPITADASEKLLHWLAALRLPGPTVVTATEAPHFRRIRYEHRRDAASRGEPGAPVGHDAGIRDGNGIMFISHVGEVYPSGFLPLTVGDVRTGDPVTLYRESALFRALRAPERFGGRCGRCEFRTVCGGSRARAFAATGDPFAEDPLCSYEPRLRV